jgi:hypothetical protein
MKRNLKKSYNYPTGEKRVIWDYHRCAALENTNSVQFQQRNVHQYRR